MMYTLKDNAVFKHEPVCLNGTVLLQNNLWCFRLKDDHTMYNTQVPTFVLPYTEETADDFQFLFSLHKYEKTVYTRELEETTPPDQFFKVGRDVAVDNQMYLQEFAYVPFDLLHDPVLLTKRSMSSCFKNYQYLANRAKKEQKRFEALLTKYCTLTGENKNLVEKQVLDNYNKKNTSTT